MCVTQTLALRNARTQDENTRQTEFTEEERHKTTLRRIRLCLAEVFTNKVTSSITKAALDEICPHEAL